MVDVVDSIVAELIVRDVDKYEAGFDRATAAHARFLASTGKLQRQTFDLGAEGRKYKAAAGDMAQGSEQADQRITRSRKKRVTEAKAADEAEVVSAKKAAREKVQAAEDAARRAAAAEKRYHAQGPRIFEAKAKEIKARNDAARAATAEATATAAAAKKAADAEVAAAARIRAAAERAVAGRAVPQGSAAFKAGRTVPREDGGRAFMAGTTVGAGTEAAVAAAAGKVSAEKEVNHLLADQAALQARLSSLKGKDLQYAKEQLAEMRLIGQLQRAGLNDEQIALRLDQRRLLVERERSRSLKSSLLASTSGAGRGGGLGGIASAIGAGVGIAAVQSALDYGKALKNVSDQLGITTDDLQAYQKLAAQAGVSQEQLTSAFGQFASNLGRAQQGQQEQAKVFKALGINIREFASAGDALPTVIDRISQIEDPANRAAIETRLFGEEGRKLDALLSGGAERVGALAQALLATGQALSVQEIKELNDTAHKLAAVKAELQVDLARVVANNANAIEFLVGKFARLADIVLKSVTALQIFANTKLSVDDKQKQLAMLTPQGRTEYLRQNERQQDELRAKIAGGGPRVLVNGSADTDPRLATARNAEYRRRLTKLANDHRDIRTGADGVQVTNPTPPVQDGKISLPAIRNLGTPAGPKGPSAEQLAKQADQRQRRYEEELGRAQDDLLQAQRDLTGSAERRYEIDVAMENKVLERRKVEIQREANEKQIDASRVKELQDAESAASAERLKVLALEKSVRIESDANALRQQMLDAQVEMLSAQEGLADSTSERREIAARRLAAERRAETASLNAIINSTDPGVSEGDRALASDRLGSQGARFTARAAQDARSNESPLTAYRRRLDRSAGQVRDDVESLVVEELDAVKDGITGALQKAIGTNDPLITGLINLLLEDLLFKPIAAALEKNGSGGGGLIGSLAGLFGGGSGGGSSSSTASGAGSFLASIGSAFAGARASGGNVVGGQLYEVNERGREFFRPGVSGKIYPMGALPSIGAGAGGAPTIIAPQHFDLTGVVMTEGLVRQLEARNRDYANAVAARAGRMAVAAAPGRLKQIDTLGS